MMRKHSLSALALLALVAAAAAAADWPQWRGPELRGTSPETKLPVKWSTSEELAWKLALPTGSGSTPIIWADRIFLNVAEARHGCRSGAVDRKSGAATWKKPLGRRRAMRAKQNMSSPSPVTDGKRVFVMTGTGVLKGFDFDGKELWARDMQKDYGQFGMNWGYGIVAAAARRRALRAGAPRHEDRRSLYLLAHRHGDRQEPLARRAAHARRQRVARRLHHADACRVAATRPRSSSPAATS